MSVVDVLARGAREEAQNLKTFVTTPSGVFETVDAIIKTARSTGREAVRAVGLPGMRGQRGSRFRGQKLRGRLLRRRL